MLESVGAVDPTGFLLRLVPMLVDADTETAACFRTGQARSGEASGPDVASASKHHAAASGVRSYALVPITVGREVIGTFYAAWTEPRRLSSDDLSFLETVTGHYSLGLQNARLFEAERQRSLGLETLAVIDDLVASSLDASEIIARALQAIEGRLGVIGSTVWTLDPDGDRLRVVGVRGFPPAFLDDFAAGVSLADDFPIARAALEARPMVFDNVSDDLHRPVREAYRRYGLDLGSLIAVPLVARGSVIGGVTLAWSEPRRSSEQDLTFLVALATRISNALENARLYQAEHAIADRLQEALLDLPDDLRGVEVAHAYHSAEEVARVGGDFYDLFELDADRLGIIIGDVAGKGLSAAIMTSLVKNTIRAHADETGKTPAQILRLTNDILLRDTAPDEFATAFFAVLDRQTGSLVYANAGHTTAVVVGGEGIEDELEFTGPMLGAFGGMEFAERKARLEPGQTLFLYTDGLIEARSNGEQYGEPRLFDLLRSAAGRPPRLLVGAAMADVLSFSGAQLRDDVAVLSLRRRD
jgi:serine phosphatase RsbU (regulator of sigma subunit)